MKHPFIRPLGWIAVVGMAVAGGWTWRLLGTARAAGAEGGSAVPLSVASRARTLTDRQEGEVLIGDRVVIRVRTGAGGLSAAERADLMARRLKELVDRGAGPSDVTTSSLGGEAVVLVKGELVATADRFHADVNGTTPRRLAESWASNIRQALKADTKVAAGQPLQAGTATGPEWSSQPPRQIEEPVDNKIVPILSGGNGLRVGVARVSGPAREVAQVKAVAQLEDEFRKIARVRVWVPVSSEDVIRQIRRVDRVSVTAFADVRL